jgi:hypothetical protein
MHELFGQRWMESYGSVPTPLWNQALNSLTDAQIKAGIARLMQSGAEHPPSLPRFTDLARGVSRVPEAPSAVECDAAIRLSGQWFVHRSVRLRFVGMNLDDHRALYREVVDAAKMHMLLLEDEDPAATPEKFTAAADEIAERIYPARYAKAWLSKPHPNLGMHNWSLSSDRSSHYSEVPQ